MLDLSSTDLAAAKNDFQTAYVQWQHDLRLLKLREERAKVVDDPRQLLIDTRNDEKKSRLAFTTAKEKLRVGEVPEEQIDALIKNLGDLQKPDQIHDAADKKKLTSRSPIDGIVIQRNVVAGNFYDSKDVLMVIAPLDHLLVWANVPKHDVEKVEVGQEIEITVP